MPTTIIRRERNFLKTVLSQLKLIGIVRHELDFLLLLTKV